MTQSSALGNASKTEMVFMLFVLVFLGALFLASFLFVLPAEDAVILFEYAKNLAANGVITYGHASVPIEGATDFLWMLFIAAFKWIGQDEFLSALLLNLLAAVFLVGVVREIKYRLIFFVGLVCTPYLYASLNGFSAIFFSAIYVCAVSLALQKDKRLYLCLLLLCLVRPDGIVWGCGLVFWRMAEEWKNRDCLLGEIRIAVYTLVIPGLLYFFWRFWYFNEFLPLPFVVKSSGWRDLFIFYSTSVFWIRPVLIPVVIGCVFSKETVSRAILLFILPVIFYAAIRMEQNFGNRFMAPMFFSAAFLFYYYKKFIAFCLFVFLSIFLSRNICIGSVNFMVFSRHDNIYYISRDLSAMDGKMLVTEAGRLAYYSDWLVHDSWGLNTPSFAHRLVTADDVANGDYDLVVGHCDLALLADGADLKPNGNRSWGNQCKVLISAIKREGGTVMLVPYNNHTGDVRKIIKAYLGFEVAEKKEICKRYDIYAVSRTYQKASQLVDVLNQYGAIAYSQEWKDPGVYTLRDDQLCAERETAFK